MVPWLHHGFYPGWGRSWLQESAELSGFWIKWELVFRKVEMEVSELVGIGVVLCRTDLHQQKHIWHDADGLVWVMMDGPQRSSPIAGGPVPLPGVKQSRGLHSREALGRICPIQLMSQLVGWRIMFVKVDLVFKGLLEFFSACFWLGFGLPWEAAWHEQGLLFLPLQCNLEWNAQFDPSCHCL